MKFNIPKLFFSLFPLIGVIYSGDLFLDSGNIFFFLAQISFTLAFISMLIQSVRNI